MDLPSPGLASTSTDGFAIRPARNQLAATAPPKFAAAEKDLTDGQTQYEASEATFETKKAQGAKDLEAARASGGHGGIRLPAEDGSITLAQKRRARALRGDPGSSTCRSAVA